ncbi:hypothetical protein KEM55_004341 [Ascosphaera atra]|nr:hypothetical protein KEM55_004341 [Ascosphaera atra]
MTVDTGAVSAAASIAKPEAKSETAPQDANAVMPPPSSTASSHKDSTTNASASSPATGNEPSKPSASSPSNATSQNPVVPLTLPPPFPTPIFSLPYRIVYAVATQDTVLIYDTQQSSPLCVVSNLHFATFTDLAWSTDGSTLLLSSSDGFCSAVTFEKGELGTVYKGQTGVDFASPRKNEAKKSAAYAPNATITSSMPPTTIPLPSPSPASTILTATSTAATPATTSANSVSGPTPTMTSLPVTALDMSSGGCFAFSTPPDTPLNTTSQSSLFGQACSTFPGQLREGSAILGKRRISASKGAGGSQRSGQEQTASSAASPSAQQKSTESQPISSNVDKSQDGQQKAKKKRRIAPTPVNQP